MDKPSEENRPEPRSDVSSEFTELTDRLDRLWTDQKLGEDAPVRRIAHYEIKHFLGSGAFGVVYLAVDTRQNQPVALKLPRLDVLLDAERLQRFEAEAKVASSLDHPSIVPIYEAQLSSGTPFIASAYVVGPNLEEWLSSQSKGAPPQQAAKFVIELAEAVHFAHLQGVVHRDLKPSNVMLSPLSDSLIGQLQLCDYEPRLTDFGLAKCLDFKLTDTRSSLMLGTPLYMAPEI